MRKIENISNINWDEIWKNELKDRPKIKKDWNDVADKFGKWIEDDDYPTKLLEYIKVEPTDSVLDLGCGEGTITIPLSKKCASLLGVDKSDKMLNHLKNKIQEEHLDNISLLCDDIFNLDKSVIGSYDIIVASRSVSGTYNMKELLSTLNDMADKSVYITFYGPDNKKEAKKALEFIGEDFEEKIPHYSVIFNLLVSMGINPNVANLECESVKSYDTFKEAVERFKWKIKDLDKSKEKELNDYLKTVFIKNDEGKWENPNDKGDWVLIWWNKKEN